MKTASIYLKNHRLYTNINVFRLNKSYKGNTHRISIIEENPYRIYIKDFSNSLETWLEFHTLITMKRFSLVGRGYKAI